MTILTLTNKIIMNAGHHKMLGVSNYEQNYFRIFAVLTNSYIRFFWFTIALSFTN